MRPFPPPAAPSCRRRRALSRRIRVALTLVPLAAVACATDESAPPARASGQPVPVATPAGEPPPPAHAPDGGQQKPPGAPAPVSTAFIYDRVLAKLKDPAAVDLAALERAVEARTGAEVKQIKKGPMGLLAIVFEEVTPPRGEAEQQALVQQLQAMPELRYAEPERLLQAR